MRWRLQPCVVWNCCHQTQKLLREQLPTAKGSSTLSLTLTERTVLAFISTFDEDGEMQRFPHAVVTILRLSGKVCSFFSVADCADKVNTLCGSLVWSFFLSTHCHHVVIKSHFFLFAAYFIKKSIINIIMYIIVTVYCHAFVICRFLQINAFVTNDPSLLIYCTVGGLRHARPICLGYFCSDSWITVLQAVPNAYCTTYLYSCKKKGSQQF